MSDINEPKRFDAGCPAELKVEDKVDTLIKLTGEILDTNGILIGEGVGKNPESNNKIGRISDKLDRLIERLEMIIIQFNKI